MGAPSVCFLGRHIFSGVPEGHKIASLRIIQAAYKAGTDTRVISVEDSDTIKRELKTFNSQHLGKGISSLLVHGSPVNPNLPMYYLNEVAHSAKVVKYIKNMDCEIIHYLNVTKEPFSIIQKILGVRKPCIAHLYHSDYAFHRPDFKVRLFSIKFGLFDHILATNKSLVRYLTEEMKINEGRVHYAPFPIDINRFRMREKRELREKYNLPLDDPIIAYVGAIYPDRGVFVLIRAFKELLKEKPDALLFVCHSKLEGDEARWSPYFYKIAESKGFHGRVILEGPSPHIEEIYCLSDVVALPFTQPYWITDPPLVLLEAMASGVPVVTTPVGAISEIGRDRENLILSQPGDSTSLKKALHWSLEERDEADRIGLNARMIIEGEFSMDLVGRRLNSIYQKIVE